MSTRRCPGCPPIALPIAATHRHQNVSRGKFSLWRPLAIVISSSLPSLLFPKDFYLISSTVPLRSTCRQGHRQFSLHPSSPHCQLRSFPCRLSVLDGPRIMALRRPSVSGRPHGLPRLHLTALPGPTADFDIYQRPLTTSATPRLVPGSCP
jgi:hypothetical protein